MCGRYAQSRNQHQLQLEFELAVPEDPPQPQPRSWPPREELQPDYNIAPGKHVYAVLGPAPGVAEPGPGGPRHLCTLRWGLVPFWAKDPNVGYRMINARRETVADKPAFRAAFAKRRCLIPADAYYEWQLLPTDAPGTSEPSTSPATDPEHKQRKARARKRPFAVRYNDGSPLAFAGLFERWRDPNRDENDPQAWLWSCSVITAEAAPELAHIHDRMPVVVGAEDWPLWLSPEATASELGAVLERTPASKLESFPVGTEVNSVRNNGPHLLTPLWSEPAQPGDAPGETLF
ncbi:SOS response-associated peptidase [Lipingzhangella sp. LS1_29]|uniref:Abasic site processing protein n=1 Tax=Lipingzhangella rawalii TaxID=2055835 RepID=A0ABU2HC15_9ACTN|nr:SOS response-associated peptidase [Lipingzhangella rawalii]MDS1272537.1 SOS response-associated peptidase [Lipingzhangella rawalii]